MRHAGEKETTIEYTYIKKDFKNVLEQQRLSYLVNINEKGLSLNNL